MGLARFVVGARKGFVGLVSERHPFVMYFPHQEQVVINRRWRIGAKTNRHVELLRMPQPMLSIAVVGSQRKVS